MILAGLERVREVESHYRRQFGRSALSQRRIDRGELTNFPSDGKIGVADTAFR
jgi:hypothetical protein